MTIQLYSKHGVPTGVIDDIDSYLSQLNWGETQCGNKKYCMRSSRKIGKIYVHRVIMEYVLGRKLLTSEDVDHINLDSMDNRRSNLRLSTRSQNLANASIRASNTSGYKGVYFDKRRGKWNAQVTCKERKYYCGAYDTPELAHVAYCKKARELFGEFFNAG